MYSAAVLATWAKPFKWFSHKNSFVGQRDRQSWAASLILHEQGLMIFISSLITKGSSLGVSSSARQQQQQHQSPAVAVASVHPAHTHTPNKGAVKPWRGISCDAALLYHKQ